MNLQAIRSKIVKDLRGVIPEFRKDNYNFKIYELKSRKNTVLNLVFDKTLQDFPQEFIVKIFRTKNIVSEKNILTRLKNQNFHVPKIFSLKKPWASQSFYLPLICSSGKRIVPSNRFLHGGVCPQEGSAVFSAVCSAPAARRL